MYEVIVENIGTVYSGFSQEEADKEFTAYVKLSKAEYGRVADSSVYLFCNGECKGDYEPENRYEDPHGFV